MVRTVVCVVSFAVTPMLLPFAGQTVVGAATTTAHVGDTVRVGVFIDQTDSGVTELFVAVPYNPALLSYAGLEPGSSGTLLQDLQVLPSTAVVQFAPRPLRVQMDLSVQ